MTHSPLSADQLMRIEALKIAHDSGASTFGPPQQHFVVARAETYLAFMKAGSSPDSQKTSSAEGEK